MAQLPNYGRYLDIKVMRGSAYANYLKVSTYKDSTLSLAHCVFRRNFNELFIDGSLQKQLILTLVYNVSQP